MTNVEYDKDKPLYIVRGFGEGASYFLTQTLELEEEDHGYWSPKPNIEVFCKEGFEEMTGIKIAQGEYRDIQQVWSLSQADVILLRPKVDSCFAYVFNTKGEVKEYQEIYIPREFGTIPHGYPVYYQLV